MYIIVIVKAWGDLTFGSNLLVTNGDFECSLYHGNGKSQRGFDMVPSTQWYKKN